MVHLLHHVNLEVSAAVHLAYIAREDISNTHMSIIGDMHLDSALVQKFFLSGAFGQHGWPLRVNMDGSRDVNIRIGRISCPSWAQRLGIFRLRSALVSRQVSRR